MKGEKKVTSDSMNRRHLISLAGAGMATAIAGCSFDGNGDGSDAGDGTGDGVGDDPNGGSDNVKVDVDLLEHELDTEPEEPCGCVKLEGAVKNTSSTDVDIIHVRARLYDGLEEFVQSYTTTSPEVGAGETWQFDISINRGLDEFDDYDIRAEGTIFSNPA